MARVEVPQKHACHPRVRLGRGPHALKQELITNGYKERAGPHYAQFVCLAKVGFELKYNKK